MHTLMLKSTIHGTTSFFQKMIYCGYLKTKHSHRDWECNVCKNLDLRRSYFSDKGSFFVFNSLLRGEKTKSFFTVIFGAIRHAIDRDGSSADHSNWYRHGLCYLSKLDCQSLEMLGPIGGHTIKTCAQF